MGRTLTHTLRDTRLPLPSLSMNCHSVSEAPVGDKGCHRIAQYCVYSHKTVGETRKVPREEIVPAVEWGAGAWQLMVKMVKSSTVQELGN